MCFLAAKYIQMKSRTLTAAFLVGIAAIIAVSCNDAAPENKVEATASETDVERGKYLVETIGCDDCHSPKKMGARGPELIEDLRFSGYPQDRPVLKPDSNEVKKGWMVFAPDLTQAVGAWGVSFSANITSDSTGIGGWTEEQFFKAMREGKSKGLDNTRPMLPPMPWQNFAKLKDADLKAMFAYLKSTKPVRNIVPAPVSL